MFDIDVWILFLGILLLIWFVAWLFFKWIEHVAEKENRSSDTQLSEIESQIEKMSLDEAKHQAERYLRRDDYFVSGETGFPLEKALSSQLPDSVIYLFRKYGRVKCRFYEVTIGPELCTRWARDQSFIRLGKIHEHSFILVRPRKDEIFVWDDDLGEDLVKEFSIDCGRITPVYDSVFHLIVYYSLSSGLTPSERGKSVVPKKSCPGEKCRGC